MCTSDIYKGCGVNQTYRRAVPVAMYNEHRSCVGDIRDFVSQFTDSLS